VQAIDPALRVARDRDADAIASPAGDRRDEWRRVLGVAERPCMLEVLLETA